MWERMQRSGTTREQMDLGRTLTTLQESALSVLVFYDA